MQRIWNSVPNENKKRGKEMRAPAPVFAYDTVFLSDFHLGSGKTASRHLYEFLSYLDFDHLKHIYLVGDIVGGWEQSHQKQRPFPEMERRVLDVLNYAASRGIFIHLMPGNHDERLRGIRTARGREIDVLSMLNRAARSKTRRFRMKTFSENMIFVHDADIAIGGRRYKVLHGDLHDPEIYRKWWFRPVVFATSNAYDALVSFDVWVNRHAMKYLGRDIALAKKLKTWFKERIERAVSRESILQELEHEGYEGAFVGHTHMPGIQRFKRHGKSYTVINDGDWQEGGSAAVLRDRDSVPEIVDYRMERPKLMSGSLPDETGYHPPHFAAFREQTDRQIRLIRRMWPVKRKSRKTQLQRYARASQKLREHLGELEKIDAALDMLKSRAGVKADNIRESLLDIARKKKRFTLQAQRLQGIFERCVKQGGLDEADRLFLQSVAQDLKKRGTEKLKKHFERQCYAARNLDFRLPQNPLESGAPGRRRQISPQAA